MKFEVLLDLFDGGFPLKLLSIDQTQETTSLESITIGIYLAKKNAHATIQAKC